MASNDWGSRDLFRRGTEKLTFTMYDEDGVGSVLQAGDVARLKIWPVGVYDALPSLDIDSVGATANGSIIVVTQLTAPALVTVTLAQDDTVLLAIGKYHGELAIVDDDDNDYYKMVARGLFNVLGSPTGDRGLT